MMIRARRQISRTAVFAILCLLFVVMMFPFAFMTIISLKSFDQWLTGAPGFSLDSWQVLFSVMPVVQELINSTVITLGAVAIILVVSSLGGFAFAKLAYPGSALVFVAVISGMMIPVQSIVLPEFVNVSQLGGINVIPWTILVYAAIGAPFATYLMTTYFRGVSNDLVEAALIDGASYVEIFVRIMIPLATPALVTVAVLQFIQIWDDFLIGFLFLQDPSVRTITVGLGALQSGRMVNIPALMAGSLVSALPAIVVYLIFQRHLVRGLTMGMGK